MDSKWKEPIYENMQRKLGDVGDIDARMLSFLHEVNDAPRDIQVMTNHFLNTVDKLKRNHISNIFRTKKNERKHSETEEYLDTLLHDFNVMKNKDPYLDQVTPKDLKVILDQIEKVKLEIRMRYCQLQLSFKELELSKEKLSRLSKRSEHNFISLLENHSDKQWVKVYNGFSYPSNKMRKCAPFYPAVVPKPKGKISKCCSQSGYSSDSKLYDHRKQSTNIWPNVDQSKGSHTLNNRRTELSTYDTCTVGDEEFPPPPPPLSPEEYIHDTEAPYNLVCQTNMKRFSDRSCISDRSAVDEGIGDIDWNPSRVTSECSNEADFGQRIQEVEEELVLTNGVQDVLTHSHDLSGQSDISVQSSLKPEETENSKPSCQELNFYDNVQTCDMSHNNTVIVDKMQSRTSKEVETNIAEDELPSGGDRIHLAKPTPIEVNVIDITECRNNDGFSDNEVATGIGIAVGSDKSVFTGNSTNTRTPCDMQFLQNDNCSNDITDNINLNRLEETKIKKVSDDGNNLTSSVRHANVCEDATFLQNLRKKKDKPKKKNKFQFLTKVFRGPWEGWDEEH